jgi:asparaginyl-tRNA synthetase
MAHRASTTATVERLKARPRPVRRRSGATRTALADDAGEADDDLTRRDQVFYMQPDPTDPTRALAVDALAPEGYGEIIGGSERLDSLELLEQRIAEHNLPRQAFEWYLDVRRFGSFPHSGFGLGIERMVSWMCGLAHLREAIPYPRLINRLYP